MTITNTENYVNLNDLIDTVQITFICPVCKSKKELTFPKSITDQAKNLTTISIPRNIVCNHPFQAFVDKQYKIRGYQKVDFEIDSKSNKQLDSFNNSKFLKRSENKLFENLITEDNYVEYIPDSIKKANRLGHQLNYNIDKDKRNPQKIEEKMNKRGYNMDNKENNPEIETLKMLYEDFWEFIEDNNETFQKLIINDKRRK